MTTFEKEAKERAKDFTDNKGRQVAYECGFLDGADRMKEEMQKLKEDNADLKQSLDWANERESEYCKRIAELEEENAELKTLIENMQRDILSLIKDRMNDDVDQNIIERLADKWGLKEND